MTTTYNIFGSHLQFIGAPSGSFLLTGIVTNYGGLPPANTVVQTFWFCQEAQGTSWLPGSLGGTYYPAGIYYSNGTIWQYQSSAYQATQGDVDAGIAESTFVSPKTLAGYSRWATKLDTNATVLLNLINDSHTHSNKSILDLISQAFTTALKIAYDTAASWVTANGTNVTNHLSNNSNPHSTTAAQVGAVATNAPVTAGTFIKTTNDTKGLVTGGNNSINTSEVTENAANLYFTETRVRGSLLTGYARVTGDISATDSVLTAFGKLDNTIATGTGARQIPFTDAYHNPLMIGTVGSGSATLSLNTIRLTPIFVDGTIPYKGIVFPGLTGTAGQKIRMAIYDQVSNRSFNLILDCGVITLTGSTANFQILFGSNLTLTRGYYWIQWTSDSNINMPTLLNNGTTTRAFNPLLATSGLVGSIGAATTTCLINSLGSTYVASGFPSVSSGTIQIGSSNTIFTTPLLIYA